MTERVWPGATVGEGTIHVHISAVREALGPDRGLLKTASGRGYRLLGSWTPQQREGTAAPVYSLTRTSEAPPANNFPRFSDSFGFPRIVAEAFRPAGVTACAAIFSSRPAS